MSRVTIVRQAMLMWGARAACSGAVDYLCRCAPPVDTAPLRASAPCLPDYEGSKQPPLQKGWLPSRSCSATAAPRLPDRSRAAIRAPHAINNVTLCVPDPLAETPPPSGWADGAHYVRLRPRAPG